MTYMAHHVVKNVTGVLSLGGPGAAWAPRPPRRTGSPPCQDHFSGGSPPSTDHLLGRGTGCCRRQCRPCWGHQKIGPTGPMLWAEPEHIFRPVQGRARTYRPLLILSTFFFL